jgi:hypothetical protein
VGTQVENPIVEVCGEGGALNLRYNILLTGCGKGGCDLLTALERSISGETFVCTEFELFEAGCVCGWMICSLRQGGMLS